MGESRISIYISGGNCFAVRGLSPAAIAAAFGTDRMERLAAKVAMDRFFDRVLEERWEGEREDGWTHIAVSNPHGEWVIVNWHWADFGDCKAAVQRLLDAGATEVLYYYSDLQLDAGAWIFGRNGSIVRAYEHNFGIECNEGAPITAKEARYLEQLDEDRPHDYGHECIVLDLLDKICGLNEREKHDPEAPFLVGVTPVATAAEMQRAFNKSELRFDTPYRTGPLAIYDWSKGGAFEGYVYRYELQLHDDDRFTLHTHPALLPPGMQAGGAGWAPLHGVFEHSGWGRITLRLPQVSWEGVILGGDARYLVFNSKTLHGEERTYCFLLEQIGEQS